MGLEFGQNVLRLIERIRLLPAETELLNGFRNSGGLYSDIAASLPEGSLIRESLIAAANKLVEGKLEQAVSSPVAALGFFGFETARNFIAASIVTSKAHVPNTPPVRQALRFALEGQTEGGDEAAFALDLFVCGLIYDQLLACAAEHLATGAAGHEPDVRRLQDCWKHGRQVAGVAVQLARASSADSATMRNLVLDGVLHDIGRATAALLEPAEKAISFSKERSGSIEEEAQAWGYPHPVFGFLLLTRYSFLRESAWVALLHHEPYLAQRFGTSVARRCWFTWLADRIVCERDLTGETALSESAIHRLARTAPPNIIGEREAFAATLSKI